MGISKSTKMLIATSSIFVVSALGSLGIHQLFQNDYNSVSVELSGVKNELATLGTSREKTTYDAVSVGTGIDLERVANDKAKIEGFLKKIFTWSSYDEYMKMRESLKSEYNIKEDSTLLTSFLPTFPDRVDGNGKHYNEIDTNKLQISYDKLVLYPVSVGASYKYIAEVDMTSTSQTGGQGTAHAFMEISIGADGNISDITATVVNN
jgi:hypothetical protein